MTMGLMMTLQQELGQGEWGGMNNKLHFIKIKNPLTGDKIFCCTNRTEMQIPI